MRRKDIPKSQIRRVRPPPQSARKPRYVAPRCARRRGNVVYIDHGVLLHHPWALSVVRRGLQQLHAHCPPSEEQRGSFTSHKMVSREFAAPLVRDGDYTSKWIA